jgi:peptidoglycan/xylan/chitin deacetylase (PgdA/CDA1 family)
VTSLTSVARAVLPAGLRRLGGSVLGTVVGVHTEEGLVALTFDDGPDETESDRLIATLDRRGARATFFVLAQRAEAHPDVVRRMAESHEVGLHGDEHVRLAGVPAREVVRIVRDGKRRLERVVGSPVSLFRPPGGEQTLLSFVVARAAGLRVVHWSAAAEDWLDLEVDELVRRSMAHLCPGGVLLLHDRFEPGPGAGAPPTLDREELLCHLLDALALRGWRAVTVTDLLRAGRPRHALWFTSRERRPARRAPTRGPEAGQ